MNNEYCLGIDFGTTYCCAALFNNGKVEIIPNELGSNTTPSYITFTDEDIYIGEFSKNNIGSNYNNTIFDIKRLIGRKFSDKDVQKDLHLYPFKILADNDDNPIIPIFRNKESKNYYPEEISALILKNIKKFVEEHINCKINNVVITVPAYFNDSQRSATKNAAKLADLNVLRIINEPTAAALAYGLDKMGERTVLIFDLGGGTLDISLLNIDNSEQNVFIVKATCGDTHLGGEDFDNKIMEYCYQEFSKKYKLNIDQLKELLSSQKCKCKLKKEAENAKKILSNSNQVSININNFFNDLDLSIILTRSKFEIICNDYFKKCFIPIEKVLEDSNTNKNMITDIVLIGGSTKIPKIRQMLKDYFNTEPKIDINPDEAVAYGAAIQCAVLSNINHESLNNLVLVDVIPLSLGIETSGGLMTSLIPKNTVIPCQIEKIFSTFTDNQPAVTIKIYEGERALAKDNNLLDTFELFNITPAPRGIPKIIVKFSIDPNGILNVTASEKDSNNTRSITIKADKTRFSDELLKNIYQEAESNMNYDIYIKEEINAKNKFENYIYTTKLLTSSIDFKTSITKENFEYLQKLVIEYVQWINKNNGIATKTDYEDKYVDAENKILPIIKNLYNKDIYFNL